MQKKKWVRVGLAAAIVSGAVGGISAAGCSGDDNTVTPPADGGKDSSIPQGDTGPGGDTGVPSEGGGDADAAPTVPNAKVYLVHAAADALAQPLRFCFGIVGGTGDSGTISTAPFPPLPDTQLSPSFPIAGFFPGFGAPLTSAPQVANIDLSTVSLAIFAIDATKIANSTADGGPDGGAEEQCSSFIGTAGAGGGSLTLNTDFWYVGTIPSQTLKHGETWVVAITGCFPGEDGTEADFCPTTPPYSAATGNLGIKAWQVDNTTAVAADGGIGAQFASASPSWDVLNAQAGGATTAAGFWIETPPVIPDGGGAETGTTDAGDASTDASSDSSVEASVDSGPPQPTLTFIPITGTGTYGTLSPAALATVPVPLNSATAGFFTSFASSAGAAITFPPGCSPGVSCASPLLLPLPVIDQLTNGTVPTGGSFVDGKGYAFILVGDPLDPTYIGADGGAATSTTGVFNGKSIHFLGLPTSNP